MDEQLKQAVELHQQKKTDEALPIYEAILQRRTPPVQAFLNASSILRSKQRHTESINYLKKGLAFFPSEPGLWNNLGNCQMDTEKTILAIVSFRRALTLEPEFTDSRISLASCLREIGLPHLAYAAIKTYFCHTHDEKEREKLLIPLIETMLGLASSDKSILKPQEIEPIVQIIESEIRNNVGQNDPCRAGMVMTQLWMQVKEVDRALASRKQVINDTKQFFSKDENKHLYLKPSFHSTWHNLNWNLSIQCLKNGRLDTGWSLYEHGLQVPAEGPQRWQRALKKPFTPKEVAIWRGESLAGKRLLLLGEQGIGDSMMFATLIPKLQHEGAKISLLPGDRLVSIYKRSLPNVNILTLKELQDQLLGSKDFDFQSPLGSVCQYRFRQISDYGIKNNFLKADPRKTKELRQRYFDGRPLIGISWQGGGKVNRIHLKSLKLREMSPLLKRSDVRFVSLQYGDDAPHLKRYQKESGIEVLHDDAIDPLRDMDTWLCQVAAMDGVISIANTTIHGAGGLGIPTLCLVSQNSDWRWIDPSVYKGCYWYPSVDATYQESKDWQPVISNASQWLKDHF